MKRLAVLGAAIALAGCVGTSSSATPAPTVGPGSMGVGGVDWSVVSWEKFPGLRERIEKAYRDRDCDELPRFVNEPRVRAAGSEDKAGILSIVLTFSFQLKCEA